MFFLRSGNRWKTRTKLMKQRFKNHVFFDIDFWRILEPTWADFGCQVEAQEREPPRHFCPGVRYIIILLFWSPILVATEWPKSVPRAPKSAPRAPQGCPRASQELPKCAQERPKSVPRTSQRVPRASKSLRVQKHAANREIWTPNFWKTLDFRNQERHF